MSTYDIVCLSLAIVVVVLAIVNVLVWLLKKRKKQPDTIADIEAEHEKPVEDTTEESVVKLDEESSEDNNSARIIAALESGNVEESDSGAIVHNTDGTVIYYGYNKSFVAKLIQAKDEVREYYNILKNYVLSFSNVKASISWGQESVRYGKEKVCWFVLRGKSLYLYLPLNPDDYADTKYKVERATAKRYEELPCLYKITNERRVKYATELIDTVMEQFDTERKEKADKNYVLNYPYEDTLSLIKRNLIKVTKTNRQFPTNK